MSSKTGQSPVDIVREHLRKFFRGHLMSEHRWSQGPVEEVLPGFTVACVLPVPGGDGHVVYATVGTSSVQGADGQRLELLLVAPEPSDIHVETLAMLAHRRAVGRYPMGQGAVANLGRPWLPGSQCDHVAITLPYFHGPKLEWTPGRAAERIRMLMVMPITAAEAALARTDGLEALEERMEEEGADMVDPGRASVV
jgi:hypothetical protein